ncbi:DUF2937 family protein [Neorhizobium sp. NCHU2750]|uniref:DUF2937 family protein n=1 Tax=Neorhizobium sp. NCHU2750 TaxID=1825976 RepID=UPI000E71FAC7|nr:membrane protein [Neorhizobium sp. NCHU2750]
MSVVRRVLVLLVVASGGVLFSQAPEFAQQYRQRLGGAIDELTSIIQTFDEQANHEGLDRRAALNIYSLSSEPFLHSQGDAMRRTFERYEALSDQFEDLAAAPPVLRPLAILQHIDPPIFSKTMKWFVPAMPFSFAGGVWAAIGVAIGSLFAVLFGGILRAFAGLRQLPHRRIMPRGMDASSGKRMS